MCATFPGSTKFYVLLVSILIVLLACGVVPRNPFIKNYGGQTAAESEPPVMPFQRNSTYESKITYFKYSYVDNISN